MIDNEKPFKDGEFIKLEEASHSIQVWDTSLVCKLQYTFQATAYYQHKDYTVQQVVVPDPQGRYPTDEVCHKKWRVPVQVNRGYHGRL